MLDRFNLGFRYRGFRGYRWPGHGLEGHERCRRRIEVDACWRLYGLDPRRRCGQECNEIRFTA